MKCAVRLRQAAAEGLRHKKNTSLVNKITQSKILSLPYSNYFRNVLMVDEIVGIEMEFVYSGEVNQELHGTEFWRFQ